MWIDLFLFFFLIFTLLLLVTVFMNILSGAPFVPSNHATMRLMLEEAKLKKGETVYDLGCGDARLLIKAEKQYGTKGVGYENAPIAFLFATLNKWAHRSSVEIRYGNLFQAPLKKADVIVMYLGPDVQKKLAPKLKKECRKGTRMISNTFHLPGFKPLKKIERDRTAHTQTIYLYKI